MAREAKSVFCVQRALLCANFDGFFGRAAVLCAWEMARAMGLTYLLFDDSTSL